MTRVVHLVFLSHGLHGHSTDLSSLSAGLLRSFSHPDNREMKDCVRIIDLDVNDGFALTRQGIEAGGRRIAQSMRLEIAMHISLSDPGPREVADYLGCVSCAESVSELESGSQLEPESGSGSDVHVCVSCIGHSLGGIYFRYAIGALFSDVPFLFTTSKVQFVSYVSVASPHLGSRRASYGMFNSFVHGITRFAFGATGRDLLMLLPAAPSTESAQASDATLSASAATLNQASLPKAETANARSSWGVPLVQSGLTKMHNLFWGVHPPSVPADSEPGSTAATNQVNSISSKDVAAPPVRRPLLVEMSTPDSVYMRALSRFGTRTAVSNVKNDIQVPFCSAAIALKNPYDATVQWGRGVTPVRVRGCSPSLRRVAAVDVLCGAFTLDLHSQSQKGEDGVSAGHSGSPSGRAQFTFSHAHIVDNPMSRSHTHASSVISDSSVDRISDEDRNTVDEYGQSASATEDDFDLVTDSEMLAIVCRRMHSRLHTLSWRHLDVEIDSWSTHDAIIGKFQPITPFGRTDAGVLVMNALADVIAADHRAVHRVLTSLQ
eukprot:ANDGO_07919.mRNA.1 esterase/lipase/thioesterase domain-containing protein